MKRFHVHVRVGDLAKSIDFYSKLFACAPTRVKADYAKWMLADPRVNFAISTVGEGAGVDHLGIQAEDEAELAQLKAQGQAANGMLLDEGETVCCYARSDKHWVTDPQGVAWEHFQSLETVPIYGSSRAPAPEAVPAACCGPVASSGKHVGVAVKPASSCC
jgi:catechol 2,3-dioxygenase-like lactoylglutathione lyase family enzyme